MRFLIPVIPMILGFILDSFIGDPYNLPHPIRLIGKMISFLEKKVRKHFDNLFAGGVFLSLTVIFLPTIISFLVLLVSYKINLFLGLIIESILCYYFFAAKCLYKESMKVYTAIKKEDIEEARKAVSMIVGRDTESLDREGIIKAAVETVAENSSDGVTAPLLFIAVGGAAAGCFYKSVNTLDSMIGYKNEKYSELGRFAAKLDDIMNFIPSRLTAVFMIVVSPLVKADQKNAFRIWKRDRFNHASPNSAQTESACAGALHIRLAGDAYYFGKLCRKPYIGDSDRKIENEDIKRANKLMYLSSVLMLIVLSVIKCIIGGVFFGF